MHSTLVKMNAWADNETSSLQGGRGLERASGRDGMMANRSDADPKGPASSEAGQPEPQASPREDSASVPAPTSPSKASPEEERILARPDRPDRLDRRVPATDGDGTNLHGVHVLAVDDDLEMLGLLRTILEGAGAKVTTVATATGALQTMHLLRPDVLVADLGMPMMDGISLIHRLRHASDPQVRAIPAVAVTGRAEYEEMVRESGFEMYLPKPVEPDELVAAVADLARRGKR
jgi:CheY-like chemotaxis protein